jgi:hypothetical protein
VIEQGGLGAGIAGHGSLKSDLQEIGLLSVVPDFGNVSPSQGIIQIGGRDLYLHAGYAAAACNQPRSTRSRCVVIILSANLFLRITGKSHDPASLEGAEIKIKLFVRC